MCWCRMWTSSLVRVAVVLVWGLFALSACSEDSADANAINETFEIWCGDHACAWKVEEGEVAPAPTWHRKAMGIGFLSDPAVISQVVEFNNVRCLTLSVLGDLTEDAEFFWEVDFFNDGLDADDVSIPFSDMAWETVYQETAVPEACTVARIILRKQGKGKAVVAKADLSANDYCADNGASAVRESASDCDIDGGDCRAE